VCAQLCSGGEGGRGVLEICWPRTSLRCSGGVTARSK
jgi:hypothetical protein